MSKPWAMLAIPIEQITQLDYPFIGQPKLNGIRAKWDGHRLISRQNKVWKPETLPHIYDKLVRFSVDYPGVSLDGELYAHGLPFQEIVERCAIKRIQPHAGAADIDYHAFDIISSQDTESRQFALSQIYQPWVAICKVLDRHSLNSWMQTFTEHGYEGMMLRSYGQPYIANRTEALIKVKPMKYCRVKVLGAYEGLGKFENMLGGFNVDMNGVRFNVGGGNISEAQRATLWVKNENNTLPLPSSILISYRDTFASGIPVQPLIVKV